jgi:hypothetical protein
LHTADDQINRPQPFQGLHIHAGAENPQVAALHQHEAEIAGDVCEAEIFLVIRPRHQHRHGRIVAIGARQEIGLELLQIGRQPFTAALPEAAAHHFTVRNPGGERIPKPGDCLGMVIQDPPHTIRPARQIHRIKMQMRSVTGVACQRTQKGGIAEYKLRRNFPRLKQHLRTIRIAEHGIQQACALYNGGLQPGPLLRRQDEREEVDVPMRSAGRIGEGVVRNAALAHQARQFGGAGWIIGRPGAVQRRSECEPVRAQLAIIAYGFIESTRRRAISGEEMCATAVHAFGFRIHTVYRQPLRGKTRAAKTPPCIRIGQSGVLVVSLSISTAARRG